MRPPLTGSRTSSTGFRVCFTNPHKPWTSNRFRGHLQTDAAGVANAATVQEYKPNRGCVNDTKQAAMTSRRSAPGKTNASRIKGQLAKKTSLSPSCFGFPKAVQLVRAEVSPIGTTEADAHGVLSGVFLMTFPSLSNGIKWLGTQGANESEYTNSRAPC